MRVLYHQGQEEPVHLFMHLRVEFAGCGPQPLADEGPQAQFRFGRRVRGGAADGLRDQDALRLRDAAHKFGGVLASFSTVAGDLADNLEELAAEAQLGKASIILEQLETITAELLQQLGGLSLDALRHQAEGAADSGPTAGV